MEKEELNYINNIINVINQKRLTYWEEHYRFPNAIVLNNEILMNLKLHYLYLLLFACSCLTTFSQNGAKVRKIIRTILY